MAFVGVAFQAAGLVLSRRLKKSIEVRARAWEAKVLWTAARRIPEKSAPRATN
jgi:hypothetical protein